MKKLSTTHILYGVLFLALGALVCAYVAEYFFAIKPCALCYYQRYAYMTMALLGAGAFFIPPLKHRLLLILSLVATTINGVIAGYQVLVEKGHVEVPSFCKVEKLMIGDSLEAFKGALMEQGHVPCNEVAFSFLGISMAGYNALFCLTIVCFLLIHYRKNICGT